MTKHTPGPWYPIRNVAYWEIRTANERYEGQQIGDACASTNLVDGDNGEANARVMAAAPKLLKHLRHMIWLVETELKADGGHILQGAKCAVAIAEE